MAVVPCFFTVREDPGSGLKVEQIEILQSFRTDLVKFDQVTWGKKEGKGSVHMGQKNKNT